jgi:hypothetical protein
VKRLNLLRQENGRLRKAVVDLTIEKLVLQKGASENRQTLPVVFAPVESMQRLSRTCPSGLPSGCVDSKA